LIGRVFLLLCCDSKGYGRSSLSVPTAQLDMLWQCMACSSLSCSAHCTDTARTAHPRAPQEHVFTRTMYAWVSRATNLVSRCADCASACMGSLYLLQMHLPYGRHRRVN
jgi:hypothetical protein